MTVTTVRLNEETRKRLLLVAALESARLGKRVTVADLIRRGIDIVTGSAQQSEDE